MDLDERVELVMNSPVGAQMFVDADINGVSAARFAEPSVVTYLAYNAHAELDPWSGEHQRLAAEARHAVRPLAKVVAEVLAEPRNSWWWSDLALRRQLWLSDAYLEPADLIPVQGANDWWNHYAQKLTQDLCIVTSTELDVPEGDEIRSGLHAEAAMLPASDWVPIYPLRQAKLSVADDARVYEIHGPVDWHRLCIEYGERSSYPGPQGGLLDVAGIDHGLAPTWSRVGEAWDGVHLSLFGFITASYQPVTADGVTTTLWAWPSERTAWLRNVFTRHIDLDPVTSEPDSREPYGN